MTNPSENFSELSTLLGRIQQVAERFETACQEGSHPRIEDYLDGQSATEEWLLLRELLQVELNYRRAANETISAQEYLERFPRHSELINKVIRFSSDATVDSAAITPPRQRLAEYEIVERLGQGGMGEVYKAIHTKLKKVVALKVLPAAQTDNRNAVARFLREMEAVGKLDHPNIVRASDAREVNNVNFLVMEYVDGVDLARIVRDHGISISTADACEILRQAATGLDHAYEHGLVHRDIKPSNIMLARNGIVKVLDLGLARLQGESPMHDLTATGQVMGTFDYMAPEQWNDTSSVDIRADIYSLGCTLYFLLAGKAPFSGSKFNSFQKKLKAHTEQDPPPLTELRDDLPDELLDILERMMAKDPDDRFARPRDVADALMPLVHGAKLTHLLPPASTSAIERTYDDTTHNTRSTPQAATASHFLMHERDYSPRPVPIGSHHSSRSRKRRSKRRTVRWIAGGIIAFFAVVGIVGYQWFGPQTGAMALSPAQRVQVQTLYGTMPGLNGQWWFQEIPWFYPAVRQRAMQALSSDGVKKTPASAETLVTLSQQAIEGGNIPQFYEGLNDEVESLMRTASYREAAHFFSLKNLDPEQFDDDALNATFNEIAADLEKQSELSAEDWHFIGLVRHRTADWVNAQQAYNHAIALYEERSTPETNPDAESVRALYALCLSDLAQMHYDMLEYQKAAQALSHSRSLLKPPLAPAFAAFSLASEADAYRKWGKNAAYLESCLHQAGEAVEPLGPEHPLRAFVHERWAWYYLDDYHFRDAATEFRRALKMRQAGLSAGNLRAQYFVAFDRQGEAMAEIFRDSADANRIFVSELDNLDRARQSKRLSVKQESELRLRSLNSMGQLAESKMYVDGNYPEAANWFGEAVEFALDNRSLLEGRYQWYVNQLMFKRALALALNHQVDEARKQLEQADKIFDELNPSFKPRVEMFRRLALGEMALRSGDMLNGVKELLEILDGINADERPSRDNYQVVSLVAQQLLASGALTPEQTRQVAGRLEKLGEIGVRLTDDPPAEMFFRRNFDRAIEAYLSLSPPDAKQALRTLFAARGWRRSLLSSLSEERPVLFFYLRKNDGYVLASQSIKGKESWKLDFGWRHLQADPQGVRLPTELNDILLGAESPRIAWADPLLKLGRYPFFVPASPVFWEPPAAAEPAVPVPPSGSTSQTAVPPSSVGASP